MNDLELLKKDWKEDSEYYKNYSEKDIFRMIKSNSFSITKYLLFVGLLEIMFWAFYQYLGISKNESFFSFEIILRIVFFVGFVFLILFSYFKIRNETNTKKLMKQILNLRLLILFYVALTFLLFIIFGIIDTRENSQDMIRGFVKGYNHSVNSYNHKENDLINIDKVNPYFSYIIIIYLLLFGMISTILFYLYNIIYGGFLDNLKMNYKELSKLEKID